MKKFIMSISLLAFLLVPAGSAFAWDMSYLNPLPYVGIGCNQTSFSLNPFKGFKNCEPCKRVEKCNRCAMSEPVRCSSCEKAFIYEYTPCGCNRMSH